MLINIISASGMPSGFYGYDAGTLSLPTEGINLRDHLVSVDLVNSVDFERRTYKGTLASGLLGYAVLGPLGAVGGMLVGGRKEHVSQAIISCVLDDGRHFIVDGSPSDFATLKADCVLATKARNSSALPGVSTPITTQPIEQQPLTKRQRLSKDEKLCKHCSMPIKKLASICRYCKEAQ